MKIKLSIKMKMVVYLVSAIVLIFGIVLTYTGINIADREMNNARQTADNMVEKYANSAESILSFDLGICRSMAQSFESYKEIDSTERDNVYGEMLKNVRRANERYLSVWTNFELRALSKLYKKRFGRRTTIAAKRNGLIDILYKFKDLDGDVIGGAYYNMKLNKKELLTEPYRSSLTGNANDEILMTSLAVPILDDGKFVGQVGIDFELEVFQNLIKDIDSYDRSEIFMITHEGTLIAHSDEDHIEQSVLEVYPSVEYKGTFLKRLQNAKQFSFIKELEDGEEYYFTFTPIQVGNTESAWSMGLKIPVEEIQKTYQGAFSRIIWILVIGIILIVGLILFIAKNITQPLAKTTSLLQDLSRGDIDQDAKLNVHSGDEIELMANNLNKLVQGLNNTADFALEIGKGNLEAEYELLGHKDKLGLSLLDMRKSLVEARDNEKDRKQEEEKRNWSTLGLARFGDILRMNSSNLETLGFELISQLVIYLNANQGGLFTLNNDTDEEPFLEMTSGYAYDRNKYMQKSVLIGEGLVGRCFQESETIYMKDIPDSYMNISSGLGESTPHELLLVPLRLNNQVFGVIELASFNTMEPYMIAFVEKLAESVALTVANTKSNVRTMELFEKSKLQAEELAAQEEEMRQNMEELQATQEESARREADLNDEIRRLKHQLDLEDE